MKAEFSARTAARESRRSFLCFSNVSISSCAARRASCLLCRLVSRRAHICFSCPMVSFVCVKFLVKSSLTVVYSASNSFFKFCTASICSSKKALHQATVNHYNHEDKQYSQTYKHAFLTTTTSIRVVDSSLPKVKTCAWASFVSCTAASS